jgi:hypothetical protein
VTPGAGPFDLVPVGHAPLVGDVVEFDEPRGLGVIEYGPGQRLPFHCTAITDGSRQIAVGTVAAFVVAAGRLGRLEARSVRPLPGVVPPGSTLEVGRVAEPPPPGGTGTGPGYPSPVGAGYRSDHSGDEGSVPVASEPAPSSAVEIVDESTPPSGTPEWASSDTAGAPSVGSDD